MFEEAEMKEEEDGGYLMMNEDAIHNSREEKHEIHGLSESLVGEEQVVMTSPWTPAHEDYSAADEVGGRWTWNSLNFEEFVNDFTILQSKRWTPRRRRVCFGYTGKTLARWAATIGIGISMGTISIALAWISENLIYWRDSLVTSAVMSRGFGIFVVWGIALSFISSTLVAFISPGASGSGIPVVKAYLNGIRLEGCLSMRVFLVKFFGTALAVGAGATLGPEGPLVHLGAMCGSFFTGGLDPTRFIIILGKGLSAPFFKLTAFIHDWFYISSEKGRFSFPSTEEDNGKTENIKAQTPPPQFFRSDVDRRDFLSIGVACGFAAAFGAPIGGVLFSLEEASSFWSNELLWRSLVGTSCATFTALVLKHGIIGLKQIARYGLISLHTNADEIDDVSLALVPMAVLLGCLGGLVGAIFNISWYRAMKYRQYLAHIVERWSYQKLRRVHSSSNFLAPEHQPTRQRYADDEEFWEFKKLANSSQIRATRAKAFVRVIDAVIGVALTTILFYGVALSANSWACVSRDRDDDGWLQDNDFTVRFTCGHDHVHELASLWFGTREKAITTILEATNGELSAASLSISGILSLVTLCLSFGSALPGGLFLPLIYCGACLGSALARLPVIVQSPLNITRRHSAVLGAVALLAGVQRSTVSLCVIMLEGTGNTSLLIPIIIVVCLARFIGNLLSEGLYELSIDLQKVPFLSKHVPHRLLEKRVSHLLRGTTLAVLPRKPTIAQANSILKESRHGAYPVVADNKKLIGLVLREHVKALIHVGLRSDKDNESRRVALRLAMAAYDTGSNRRTQTRSSEASSAGLEEPPYTPHHDEQNEDDNEVVFNPMWCAPNENCPNESNRIDLAPAMVRSPYVVYEDCPVSRAYCLFVTMGARHLLVINHKGDLVGILTRHDMLLAVSEIEPS
uniref:Chloride channel protein n=1 Tax=Aureoumbra lagunensis TaxID=44058 RepID=A0A7S3K4I1_9STRA